MFDDDAFFRMIQRVDYEGETCEEFCDECARYLDWDDSYLVKGSKSNIHMESNSQEKYNLLNDNPLAKHASGSFISKHMK